MYGTPDPKPAVLYIDDLQTNLILFQAMFEKDYSIYIAESAAAGLEILKNREIQVLVTDQRMPDMTGTELLEIVAVEYPDTRRFLLTAFTDFETVVEAVNRGHIHGYINKPLKADEIRIIIDNALELYYLRKKNREMLEELEIANRELLNLDGLKSEIIKVISQEIRNPLNRIMGTLHMLKDKIQGEELSGVVNILDSSVSKLEEFSSMTEQISILKAPGHTLKISEVALRQVVEYGMIETSGEAKEKGIGFDLKNGAPDISVEGESGLLVSCFAYLIRNAISHCIAGDQIGINIDRNDHGIVCEVTDAGREYSSRYTEDMLRQFSGKKSKLNLNLGIELGLAQMIMEAHNGWIQFEKAGNNAGNIKMVFNSPGIANE